MNAGMHVYRKKSYLILQMVLGVLFSPICFIASYNLTRIFIMQPNILIIIPLALAAFSILLAYGVVQNISELKHRQIYLTLDYAGLHLCGKMQFTWNAVEEATTLVQSRNGIPSRSMLNIKTTSGKKFKIPIDGIEMDHDDLLEVIQTMVSKSTRLASWATK